VHFEFSQTNFRYRSGSCVFAGIFSVIYILTATNSANLRKNLNHKQSQTNEADGIHPHFRKIRFDC
jgi:hypothetical protein